MILAHINYFSFRPENRPFILGQVKPKVRGQKPTNFKKFIRSLSENESAVKVSS